MEANSAVEFRLAEHDRRLSGHHKRLGGAEVRISDAEKSIVGLEHDVEDTEEKVGKIEQAIRESDRKREAEGVANRRALYTVAGFMATFSLTLCGLIAVLVGHA